MSINTPWKTNLHMESTIVRGTPGSRLLKEIRLRQELSSDFTVVLMIAWCLNVGFAWRKSWNMGLFQAGDCPQCSWAPKMATSTFTSDGTVDNPPRWWTSLVVLQAGLGSRILLLGYWSSRRWNQSSANFGPCLKSSTQPVQGGVLGLEWPKSYGRVGMAEWNCRGIHV